MPTEAGRESDRRRGTAILPDLLTILGQIYDAALDSALWSGVLDSIAKFVDAARATLIFEDAADPMRSILYTSVCAPDRATGYLESFILVSPGRLARYGRSDATEVIVACNDPVPRDRCAKTPFLRDFLRKRSLVDTAVAALGRTTTTITVLSLQRSVGRGFADLDLHKLDLLIPHIERATAIGSTLDRRAANADSLADTLDKIAAGVFLLSETGVVVHANAAAQQLISQGSVIRHVEGRLAPVDRSARGTLARALSAARSGDAALDPAGLTIPLGTDEPVLLGTLLPLTAAAKETAAVHHRAIALLCVRPAALETTPAAASFAQRYRLTPRELSVLAAIVERGGIPETATALGLTEGTVKGYVKTIFQKTGARRQADVVRMVAGFASPFR